MTKYIALAICASLLSAGLIAQSDLSAPMLTNSWQALQANPAQQPSGVLINLPSLYNNLWITNITYNDLIREEGGNKVLDIDNAIAQLTDDNRLQETVDIETFGLAINLGPVGLNFGHRLRFNALINYSQALPQLIWQGNAQFIGQTVDFGPQVDVLAYHEWALGASTQIGEKIRVGARAKLLSGAAYAGTERNDLSLTTDEEAYALTLDADFRVNSSGSLNYDGFRDVTFDFGFGNFSTEELFGGNAGLAFDLGVGVDLGRLQLTASALDLGGTITWDQSPQNYTLDGEYAFEGLDVAREIFDDAESFGNAIDTLSAIYEPTESSESFETTVPTKFYLTGQYAISESVHVGAIFYAQDDPDELQTAIAATANVQLTPFLRLGALYGLRQERFDNLGLNTTLALGPVRLLLATDNIISAFRPKDAHSANFRAGLNLLIGGGKGVSNTSDFY